VPTEANYVAGLALSWARNDPLEQWINAAPRGGATPLEETISEYLGSHNPFADGSRVEVLGGLHGDAPTAWVPVTIVERTAVDEWTVEFDDGDQACRDHHELRPYSQGL
jgi:hypothetical protein